MSINTKSRFSTSDIMDAFSLGRNTLRLYEKKGLLSRMGRTSAGYREYSQEHVQSLSFILQAKEAGFTLGEIGGLLKQIRAAKTTCGKMADDVDLKVRQIDEEIAQLEKKKKFLGDFLGTCKRQDESKSCNVLLDGFTKRACCP